MHRKGVPVLLPKATESVLQAWVKQASMTNLVAKAAHILHEQLCVLSVHQHAT